MVFATMSNVCTILFAVSYVPHFSTVGCVLTLGEGDTGQLGLGPDVLERAKPAKVNVPNMVQVCAGGMHTVCLTKSGEVCTCLYYDHKTILLLIFYNFCTSWEKQEPISFTICNYSCCILTGLYFWM